MKGIKMREELKVKVGDKVLYSHLTFGGTIEQIETVIRVTPTGRIRIKGISSQFDKYGREMGRDSLYGEAKLSIPKEEDYNRVKRKCVIQKALSLLEKMNEKTLSYDKAVEIIRILESEEENESNN